MSISVVETQLKEFLLANDEQYKSLVSEHLEFEARLNELASLPFPSEAEQVEEHIIKKKKLHLKDQMEAIAHKYKVSTTSH